MKRKFKEAIKEENEEKDFLFNEIKFKSQAAMEYLMTYGWAILIIALALGVLYSLGIMNPKNFIPRAPPGSCFVFRPNGPGTTDFVSLQGTCGYLPMYVASFDGVNGYIYIANTALLQNKLFTITIWGNARPWVSGSGQKFLLTKLWQEPSANYAWLMIVVGAQSYGNQARTQIIDGITGGSYGFYQPYTPNTWFFIAMVYDGANAYTYFNGKLVYSASLNADMSKNKGNILIGTNGGSFFNGSIANVQLYNVALTPQEIQYLYQQSLGGGPVRLQNLVGWWPLNGDAKDYSGNNNHGTIYGGVTFVQNYNPP